MKQLTPSRAERYREVMELRCAGLSFEEIAKRTGYAGRQGAKKAYDAATKRWAVESVEQQRIIQSERLDRIFTQAYLQARNGDMQAIDTLSGADGRPLEITTDIGRILEERINAIAERDPTVIEANELEE